MFEGKIATWLPMAPAFSSASTCSCDASRAAGWPRCFSHSSAASKVSRLGLEAGGPRVLRLGVEVVGRVDHADRARLGAHDDRLGLRAVPEEPHAVEQV